MMLHGITVTLYERVQTGQDSLRNPIYEETPVQVDNVLIGEPSTEEVNSTISLYGKKLAYTLGIPKGDGHSWENARVDFFGQRFRAFGHVTEGIEAMIPMCWNKKVHVARYDDQEEPT